jgi:hypothetical protein
MFSHSISTSRSGMQVSRNPVRIFLAAIFILALSAMASAQCVQNPTGETAVGLQNDSSFYLTFYIDGVNKGGVPPGDKSIDFVVSPGEHALRAEALISGEIVSATRTATIPEGYVCTWTVTDPPVAYRPVKNPLLKEVYFKAGSRK